MKLPYIGKNQGQHPGTYLPFYVGRWQIVTRCDHCELHRTFELPDSIAARRFAAQVMQVASDTGRFPTLHIYKRWVCVVWPAIVGSGLSSSDYIMAQKTEDVYQKWLPEFLAAAV